MERETVLGVLRQHSSVAFSTPERVSIRRRVQVWPGDTLITSNPRAAMRLQACGCKARYAIRDPSNLSASLGFLEESGVLKFSTKLTGFL